MVAESDNSPDDQKNRRREHDLTSEGLVEKRLDPLQRAIAEEPCAAIPVVDILQALFRWTD